MSPTTERIAATTANPWRSLAVLLLGMVFGGATGTGLSQAGPPAVEVTRADLVELDRRLDRLTWLVDIVCRESLEDPSDCDRPTLR